MESIQDTRSFSLGFSVPVQGLAAAPLTEIAGLHGIGVMPETVLGVFYIVFLAVYLAMLSVVRAKA